MNINDRIIATIRTGVPALVGLLIATLIAKIPAVATVIAWIDAELSTVTAGVPIVTILGLAATAAVIAGYYYLARVLGARWPWVEKWLLGSSLVPTVYEKQLIIDERSGLRFQTRREYRAWKRAQG